MGLNVSASVGPEDTQFARGRLEFLIAQDWDGGTVEVAAYLDGEKYMHDGFGGKATITTIATGIYSRNGDAHTVGVYYIESGDADPWEHDEFVSRTGEWDNDEVLSDSVRTRLIELAREYHMAHDCDFCTGKAEYIEGE